MSGSTREHALRAWRTKEAKRTPIMRFVSFLAPLPSDPNGCWLWTGVKTNKGYGRISRGNRFISAHRFSWEAFNNAPIPDGMFVLHRCDVRNCVNPAHLFLGTQSDNIKDCVSKGRWPASGRAA